MILLILMMAEGAQAVGTCGYGTVTLLSEPILCRWALCNGPPCPLIGQAPNYLGWTSTKVQSYACVYLGELGLLLNRPIRQERRSQHM